MNTEFIIKVTKIEDNVVFLLPIGYWGTLKFFKSGTTYKLKRGGIIYKVSKRSNSDGRVFVVRIKNSINLVERN